MTGAEMTAHFCVLFVCTGNICRSPMAERMLRQALAEVLGARAAAFKVESAGTWGHEGSMMEPNAEAVLRERGARTEAFAARELAPEHLVIADLVLTATAEHREQVRVLDSVRERAHVHPGRVLPLRAHGRPRRPARRRGRPGSRRWSSGSAGCATTVPPRRDPRTTSRTRTERPCTCSGSVANASPRASTGWCGRWRSPRAAGPWDKGSVREYLLTLLVAAAATYLTTGPVRMLAIRGRVMTAVRDRDVHAVPTPRLGGVAMLIGMAVALVVASELPFLSENLFANSRDPWALLAGGTLICLLGAVDDKWGLDALTKLAGQVLAAGVMVVLGIQMTYLPIPGTTDLAGRDLGHRAERPDRRRDRQRGELRGRSRRSARRNRPHGGARLLLLHLPARGRAALRPRDLAVPVLARFSRACASASCRTTSTRRASSWAIPARCSSGSSLPRPRSASRDRSTSARWKPKTFRLCSCRSCCPLRRLRLPSSTWSSR